MARRKLVIVVVLLLAIAGIAVGVALSLRGELSARGPTIDPRLTAWDPLPVGGDGVKFLISWNDGASPPFTFFRKVRGWEPLGGSPHLRVELTYPKRRRRDQVYVSEWLAPHTGDDGEAELRCSQRKVGLTLLKLTPPQPILRTPLEPGRTWSWAGTVGRFQAEARFQVLPFSSDGELRVEQTTTARSASEAVESTLIRTYARGRGLVAEAGTFPVEEPSRPYDRQRSKVDEAKKTSAGP